MYCTVLLITSPTTKIVIQLSLSHLSQLSNFHIFHNFAMRNFAFLTTPVCIVLLTGAANAFTPSGFRKAQELVKSLVVDEKCFSTEDGAKAFGEACSVNIVYEDCFEPQPVVGKTPVTRHMLDKVAARKGQGELRVDMVSDGNEACGFAWTWTSGNEEGLRGTTFVGLNDQGKIEYYY